MANHEEVVHQGTTQQPQIRASVKQLQISQPQQQPDSHSGQLTPIPISHHSLPKNYSHYDLSDTQSISPISAALSSVHITGSSQQQAEYHDAEAGLRQPLLGYSSRAPSTSLPGILAGGLKLPSAAVATLAALGWMAASSGAILLNKNLMTGLHFRYPITVAALGMMATSICSALCVKLLQLRSSHAPVTFWWYCRNILPTGFFMAVTFQTGNTGYLYLTMAFVQMLKAFAPVVTMLLLFVFKLELCSVRLVLAVTMIAAGVAMASYGEMNMSIVGLVAMLVSVFSEATRLVLTQHLLVGRNFHPIEAWLYLGPACCFWLFLQVSMFEIHALIHDNALAIILAHPVQFGLAAIMGFVLNALAVCVIKLTSSLTLKVLGTVKDICLVAIGIVLFKELVTGLQLLGYTVSIAGFCWYNAIKLQQGRHMAKRS